MIKFRDALLRQYFISTTLLCYVSVTSNKFMYKTQGLYMYMPRIYDVDCA